MDSDEDEQRGVFLDPAVQKQPFVSDELYFNGVDPGMYDHGMTEQDHLAYGEEYGQSDEEDYFAGRRGSGGSVRRTPSDEDVLLQSALERIRKARSKGQPNVNLSHEELDALQRRRGEQEPPAARPTSSKSKSNGTTSANSSVRSKKNPPTRTGLFSAAVSPAKSKTATKSRKRSPSVSDDNSRALPVNGVTPGMLVAGPNGQPVYVPVGYPTRSTRATSSPSRPGSRSASNSSQRSRQQHTPPLPQYDGPPYPVYARYPDTYRPSSSSSRHSSHPEDYDTTNHRTRARSSSSAQQQYPIDPYTTHYTSFTSPVPTRRVASGPADASSYPALRRVPVPLPAKLPTSTSDPALGHHGPSGLGYELGDGSSGSSEDDGQGVLVDVVPDDRDRGYAVKTSTPKSSSKGATVVGRTSPVKAKQRKKR